MVQTSPSSAMLCALRSHARVGVRSSLLAVVQHGRGSVLARAAPAVASCRHFAADANATAAPSSASPFETGFSEEMCDAAKRLTQAFATDNPTMRVGM